MPGYLQVLSKVHYFNTRPDTYSKRIYSVQCSMHKGKVLSNEFVVTVSRMGPCEESARATAHNCCEDRCPPRPSGIPGEALVLAPLGRSL